MVYGWNMWTVSPQQWVSGYKIKHEDEHIRKKMKMTLHNVIHSFAN